MKTLFLKSNTLHIRTNEGEFEVINTEVIPSKMKNYADAPEGLFSPVEWPYSYELIDKPNGYPDELCARLIPEEKKELNDKTTSTSVVQEGNGPNTSTPPSSTAHSFTESAYKEGEKCTTCGKAKEESHYCSNSFHLSAPSESQEELWIDVSNVFTVAGHGDAAHNHLLRRFTITRKPE